MIEMRNMEEALINNGLTSLQLLSGFDVTLCYLYLISYVLQHPVVKIQVAKRCDSWAATTLFFIKTLTFNKDGDDWLLSAI